MLGDKLKGWRKVLQGRTKLTKSLKKMEKVTDKELEHDKLKKQLFAEQHTTTKTKKVRQHHVLQDFLTKAGLEMSPTQYRKITFSIAIAIITIWALILLGIGAVNLWDLGGTPLFWPAFWDIVVFMFFFLTFGFAGVFIVVFLLSMGYLDMRIHQRRKQLEFVLPDYLQLVAANIGAGMTIDKALWFAVRPRFGVLAREIEEVAKRVITGEDLPEALRRMTKQYDSPTLTRSVSLLLEGLAAGGQIADLLHKISVDIQEQRILRQEMAANVMTYVIFITFASVIAAPLLFGLATQLLTIIQSIAGRLSTEVTIGSFNVSGEAVALGDFRIFSYVVIIGTSIMSGLIISTIRKGELAESVRFIPIFIVVGLLLYLFAVTFFGGLFANII